MSKKAHETALPKLRFPEFRDAEAWKVKEVGQVFRVTRGNVLAMGNVQESKSDNTPYPVYSSQTKNNGLAGFYNSYLFEDAITWTTDGANAGDVNYRIGKFYCTNVCGVLINENGNANPCIAALINSVSKNYVSYVGNPKLMNGVMSKIEIPFPTLPEQHKIAATLSSLDALLTAQTAKLTALQAHKRGVMQDLFPAEGETVPKRRFPEFQDAGEWTNGYILDLARNGLANGVFNDPKKVGSGYKLVNVSDMYIDSSIDEKKLSLVNITTAEFLKNKVEFGDIFFTRSSLVPAGIAASNIYLGASDNVTFDGHLIRLRPNTKMVSPLFLHYLLKTKNVRSQLISKGKRATLTTIGQADVATTILSFPHLQEQQKIADCLSSLDNLITAQSQKIDALKLHKKGLMQALFPTSSAPEA